MGIIKKGANEIFSRRTGSVSGKGWKYMKLMPCRILPLNLSFPLLTKFVSL